MGGSVCEAHCFRIPYMFEFGLSRDNGSAIWDRRRFLDM